ncbi:5-guanidino-2-oxopentanoate decarboxylase [Hasllibacter sp. MH4015]|uniref:5-guanidino-2-oxopentanoate decarboxylase n=1 Tax=Hasllibacter sp. MH4015 TaxID=2854029 RepID=UPI001CD1DCB5|nr:5-guanidino-2-oxopentanoate decarboxylase [Hasllibacter sp. MH4015]
MAQGTVGEVLVTLLERRGVEMVFGIPGVHIVELYRGLKASSIRHVTPRHEQGAGFMADGYARATGKPGICLLITGPGVTNAITAMAQARADSVPMLVISGVNPVATHGHEDGFLHELPDQSATMGSVAIWSHTLSRAEDLDRVVERAFTAMTQGRPGPVHIEIPTDVMAQRIEVPPPRAADPARRAVDAEHIAAAVAALGKAERPLILAGGGAVGAADDLVRLAERLDAPVITTTNGRGILGGHDLRVPASPSFPAVQDAMAQADVILAVGTQFGRTDYDVYDAGNLPKIACLIRVDCDPMQMTRGRVPDIPVLGDAGQAVARILVGLDGKAASNDGAAWAARLRAEAHGSLSASYKTSIAMIDTIREIIPGARIVGDSTQAVYAGNLYADIDQPRGWFNASTGYGALGYGAPAAIGACLGAPDTPVVCITGDGGLQFVLAELGTAMDELAPVIFVVWNNNGYQEIERYMEDNGIAPEGVRPSAPDFVAVAQAYGMEAEAIDGLEGFAAALDRAHKARAPRLIEIRID